MFSLPALFQDEIITPTGLTYGRWVATRRNVPNGIAWSNDGITWNNATVPTLTQLYSLDFNPNNGLYLATSFETGTSNIISSTNGVTWTLRSKSGTSDAIGVKWCEPFGVWILQTAAGIQTSSSGTGSWTIRATYSSGFTSFCYNPDCANTTADGNIWVGTIFNSATTGSRRIISTNGTTFTEVVNFTQSNVSGNSVRYNSFLNRWLTTNQNPNTVANHFVLTATASTFSGFTVSHGFIGNRIGMDTNNVKNPRFVSVGFGAASTGTIISSNDGISWTASAITVGNQYCVRYSPEIDQWFAGGDTWQYTSADGYSWTLRTVGTNVSNARFGAGVRTTGFKQGAGIT